nr:MAG TPA: hypothetical protein [Caudoviricetes sp.]
MLFTDMFTTGRALVIHVYNSLLVMVYYYS